MKLTQIKPNPENPRIIKDLKFERLCRSIEQFPKMMELRPIVVDQNMIVLGGNMRLKALQHLGFKEIPDTWWKQADTLTEEERRRFIISDNAGFGEWDFEELANTWGDDPLEEWGLDVPKFDEEEVSKATKDDFDATPPTIAKTVLGDLYEIGEHRLLCGDSTCSDTVAKLMNGEKADMVFTDPPYALFGNSTGVAGITDDNMVRPFFKSIMLMLKRHTKQYGHIYMCCDWHSAFSIEACARETELKSKNMCIWDKGNGGVGAMYQQCYEIVWFFDNSPTNKTTMNTVKAGVRTVNGVPNIWRFNRVTSEREHNAQKPTEMISVPISNGSDLHDKVLDLFIGSGSTMVASHQLKRKCYGMELDPKYCDVIVNRMIKLDPSLKVLRNGEDVTAIWTAQKVES